MWSLVAGWGLGLLLGVRHALEPDHLAAVSTMVVHARGRRTAGLVVGAWWGLGHTAAIATVGALLLILETRVPPRLSAFFELGVAALLLFLGTRALLGARRRAHDHPHDDSAPRSRRPLLVGLVHGLAGSGALTAAVLGTMPSPLTALTYLLLFGFGSLVGMALLSGLAGHLLAHAPHRATPLLTAATGTLALTLGVAWSIEPLRALLG